MWIYFLTLSQQQRVGSKKAGKRSTTKNKKGNKKAATRTKSSKKVNPLISGDDLTQKIYQTMDKHKEVMDAWIMDRQTSGWTNRQID